MNAQEGWSWKQFEYNSSVWFGLGADDSMRFNEKPDRDIPLCSFGRISGRKFWELLYCIEGERDAGPKIVTPLAFRILQ